MPHSNGAVNAGDTRALFLSLSLPPFPTMSSSRRRPAATDLTDQPQSHDLSSAFQTLQVADPSTATASASASAPASAPAPASTPALALPSPLAVLDLPDFVDTYTPRSNLQTLYVHQCPVLTDRDVSGSVVQPDPRSANGGVGRGRPPLAPNPPEGEGTTSTDKRSLLESIMANDSQLKAHGITITSSPRMQYELDNSLQRRLREHSDTGFMNQWLLGLHHEIDILGQEILIDEPTTTGVFRTTIYRHCNRFVAYENNFLVDDQAPILRGVWGDPPTTVLSKLDVGNWQSTHQKRCQAGMEHKRPKVLRSEHMADIQLAAGLERRNRVRGICINLDVDGRIYFDGLNEAARVKIESILSQVSGKKIEPGPSVLVS